ncbi:MAG TPA: alkaline phosphatase family protein [Bryobacteraceae bacterium]
MRPFLSILTVQCMIYGLLAVPSPVLAQSAAAGPITPIQHLVVIFQENVSFDHYFATYPNAANPEGQPVFVAKPGTPSVNGLSGGLMTSNPNMNATNGASAANPFRLDRSQAATADQNHNYTPEQQALHSGLVDMYPSSVGVAGTAGPTSVPNGALLGTAAVNMGYYDGNTVTALWNYAQYYAMSDNSFDTTFGPSTPGALNLVSGQLNGVTGNINGTSAVTDAGDGTLTDIGDADPIGDVCSTTTGELFSMTGTNVGDMLNARGVTWGFYTQGFDMTVTNTNGTTGCKRSTTSFVTNTNKADYIPHHEPFQYYKSTANPTHARPASASAVGTTDAANHQYDVHDFYDAIKAGNFPAVNFLKAPGFQDGHAGYSDPLDEQAFIVHVINFLQNSPYWANTAVVIAYDDSDGWYDHQMPPIVNQSASPADVPGFCGTGTTALAGVGGTGHAQGRCGYGPRLPMMVISPWSKTNFVDHTLADQTSILRFIEDNWLDGQRIGNGSFDAMANSIQTMLDFSSPKSAGAVILDENSGLVVSAPGLSASAAAASAAYRSGKKK